MWFFHAAWAEEPSIEAADPEAALAEEEEEEERPALVVALRGVGAMVFEEEGSEGLGGGSLAIERPLGHHAAAELAVGALTGDHVMEVPIELIFARTWEIHAFEPYIGLGPTLLFRTAHPEGGEAERELRYGATAALGAHLWASHHLGWVFEADGQATIPNQTVFAGELLTGLVGRW